MIEQLNTKAKNSWTAGNKIGRPGIPTSPQVHSGGDSSPTASTILVFVWEGNGEPQGPGRTWTRRTGARGRTAEGGADACRARPPQGQPQEPQGACPAGARAPPRPPQATQKLSGTGTGGRRGVRPWGAKQHHAPPSQNGDRGQEASGHRRAGSRKHRQRKSVKAKSEGISMVGRERGAKYHLWRCVTTSTAKDMYSKNRQKYNIISKWAKNVLNYARHEGT